nr:5-hydroxytryptamine receptor 1F-like [Lytechinus pictus]
MESTIYPTTMTFETDPTDEASYKSSEDLGIADEVFQSMSLMLIMTGSLLFNTFTITIILRVRSLRLIPHNLLIVSLAIADLGVVLCSMVFSLISVFDKGFFLSSHRNVCMVQGFLAIMLSFTNLPIILSIAVDRLLILVFSRHFQPSRVRVLVMIVTSWLVGTTVASVAAKRGNESYIGYHPRTLHCSIKWWDDASFRINAIIVNYGFFVPSLLGCYVLITYHLWKEEKRLSHHYLSRSIATSRWTGPSTVTVSSGPTEGVASKPTEDALQNARQESNEDWIFRHHAVSSPERVVEVIDPHVNHQVMNEPISDNTSVTNNMTSARKNRLKIEKRKHMAHKRVAVLAILLVMAVVICWTPYLLYHSRLIAAHDSIRLGVFTMWMGYCNSLIDPLIYAFVNRSFRAEMQRVFRRLLRTVTSLGTREPL